MSLKYEKLIRKMTLAEKAVMMSGKNTWETVDFEKYGIPSMVMSDGPHGLRRQAGAGDHLGLTGIQSQMKTGRSGRSFGIECQSSGNLFSDSGRSGKQLG